MAAFLNAAIGRVYFFFYYFLFLTVAASKKHGSSFPRAAFLDAATVFSLKPRV